MVSGVFLALSSVSFAADTTTTTLPAPKQVTTKDAKKTCKVEGKTGLDLIQCMKEKKGN